MDTNIQKGIQAVRTHNEACKMAITDTINTSLNKSILKDIIQYIIVPYLPDTFDQWFQRIVIFYMNIYSICYSLEFRFPTGYDLTGPKLNELNYTIHTRGAINSTVYMLTAPFYENQLQIILNLKAGLQELRASYPDAIVYFVCVVPQVDKFDGRDATDVLNALYGGEWPFNEGLVKRRSFIQIL